MGKVKFVVGILEIMRFNHTERQYYIHEDLLLQKGKFQFSIPFEILYCILVWVQICS